MAPPSQNVELESLGLLAGGLAHDLKNVMTVIAWRVEALRAAAAKGKPLDLDALDAMLDAAHRGAALARRLQAFGPPGEPSHDRFDLVELVDELVAPLRERFEGRATLVAEHEAESAPVVADRAQLARVVVELALRARDALPQGARLRLAVGMRRRTPSDAARSRPGAEFVALELADASSGMSAELLDLDAGAGDAAQRPATLHEIVARHGGFLELQRTGERVRAAVLHLPAGD